MEDIFYELVDYVESVTGEDLDVEEENDDLLEMSQLMSFIDRFSIILTMSKSGEYLSIDDPKIRLVSSYKNLKNFKHFIRKGEALEVRYHISPGFNENYQIKIDPLTGLSKEDLLKELKDIISRIFE